jgi:hypothetical protein
LHVSIGTLTPPFHPSITEYTLRLRLEEEEDEEPPAAAPSRSNDDDARRQRHHHGPAAVVCVLPLPCDPAADVTVAGVLLPSGVAYRPAVAGAFDVIPAATRRMPPVPLARGRNVIAVTVHADTDGRDVAFTHFLSLNSAVLSLTINE